MVNEAMRALAGLDELRRDVERLRAHTATGEAAVSRRISGSDEEGLVEVSLAPGGEIEEVVLDPDWRDALGESGLAAAVMTAFRAAVSSRIAEWSDAVEESQESAAAPAGAAFGVPPDAALATARPGRPASPDAVEQANRLLDTVRAAHAQVDSMNQLLLRLGTEPTAVTSPDRAVTVSCSGPNVTGIELDERWLRTTGDQQVGRAIRDAIRTASERSGEQRADAIAQFPQLAELRDLAQDPAELFRRLGTIR